MEDLSLHIMDIVENSTAVGSTFIEIIINSDTKSNFLQIIIRDNGPGMDPEMLKNVRDPFVTTRTTRRVGLGISLLEQAAHEADGGLKLDSKLGEGTEISATFKLDHIDLKPLGNIGSTFVSIILGNPDIDFVYKKRWLYSLLASISITTGSYLLTIGTFNNLINGNKPIIRKETIINLPLFKFFELFAYNYFIIKKFI